jgi:uncharacterized protein DUF3008
VKRNSKKVGMSGSTTGLLDWHIRNLVMPAKSKKQQMAAGAALAAKRGKRSKSSLRGASKQMAKSMSEKQLRDFAKTKRKSLPRKKSRKKS